METPIGSSGRRSKTGFTLIELMIALAIVAILVAVALPAYQDSVRKGRRADAFAAVSAIQLAQERFRANHPTYATALSDLGVAAPSLYTLTIDAPVAGSVPATVTTPMAVGYSVVVDGVGSLAADRQCQRMAVNVAAGTLSYAGCSNCSVLTYTTTNSCWAR